MEDSSFPSSDHLHYVDDEELDNLEAILLARRQSLSLKPLYPPPGYNYPYFELEMIDQRLKKIAKVRLARQGGDF
jgi:hypothetical protein